MGKIIGEQMASEEQEGSEGGVLETFIKENKVSHTRKEARSRKECFLFLSHLMVSQTIVSKEGTTSWSSHRDRALMANGSSEHRTSSSHKDALKRESAAYNVMQKYGW